VGLFRLKRALNSVSPVKVSNILALGLGWAQYVMAISESGDKIVKWKEFKDRVKNNLSF
jgi:hypothetical protein